jgi:2-dehydropantoate 2-reductase
MKICVFGTGAVGGWIGGAWASAGLDVVLVGRESIAAEIREHGVTISDLSGEGPSRAIHLPPGTITCSPDPKLCADADLILVTVKSTDTDAAAGSIAGHARKDAVLLSFQNGISNPDKLRAAVPGRTVLTGIVPYNVVRLANGRFNKTVTGELYAEDHELTRAVQEAVGRRPGSMKLVSDMAPVAWSKLLINLNNAVNALSGKPLLEQLKDRDYRRVVAETMDEALEAMKLHGIEPAKMGMVSPASLPNVLRLPNLLFAPFLKAQKIAPDARSSMADDLAAGRRTEIDYLNGEVVALARRHKLDPPVNAAIVQLVREAEAGVERRWSGKELAERLLGDKPGRTK